MKYEHVGKKEFDRINLMLPSSMNKKLDYLRQRKNLAKVEAIRQAIALWMEKEMAEEMIEGYRSMAHENLKMLKEFEHVDREIW